MAEKYDADSDKIYKTDKRKAVGLLSGGLDSTLAHRIISDLGFNVIALHFDIPFCLSGGQTTYTENRSDLGGNVTIRRYSAGSDFIEVVRNPKFGYGKNINPCIDCRLYMLRKAREVMLEEGADFVFTGEVLQQRPMSQRKYTIQLIDKQSSLEGRLVRPLSAKCLPPTIPEKEGVLERDKLFGFSGRSRRPQMELADSLGIKEYPTPAGGCLLTDKNYARLLRDAFDHDEDSVEAIQQLMHGRQFRSADGARITCGRDQKENEILYSMSSGGTCILTVKGAKSTYAFIWGESSEESRRLAGSIAARYSKVRDHDDVEIKWWTGSENEDNYSVFRVKPAADEELVACRI